MAVLSGSIPSTCAATAAFISVFSGPNRHLQSFQVGSSVGKMAAKELKIGSNFFFCILLLMLSCFKMEDRSSHLGFHASLKEKSLRAVYFLKIQENQADKNYISKRFLKLHVITLLSNMLVSQSNVINSVTDLKYSLLLSYTFFFSCPKNKTILS